MADACEEAGALAWLYSYPMMCDRPEAELGFRLWLTARGRRTPSEVSVARLVTTPTARAVYAGEDDAIIILSARIVAALPVRTSDLYEFLGCHGWALFGRDMTGVIVEDTDNAELLTLSTSGAPVLAIPGHLDPVMVSAFEDDRGGLKAYADWCEDNWPERAPSLRAKLGAAV